MTRQKQLKILKIAYCFSLVTKSFPFVACVDDVSELSYCQLL